MRLRNSGPQFPVRGLRWIGMKRHGVKCGDAHANLKVWRCGANTLHDLAQKSSAIVKASSIFSIASVRAQKFMAQVTVTMFDVDKIETKIAGDARRAMKLLDDSANFSVREQGKI